MSERTQQVSGGETTSVEVDDVHAKEHREIVATLADRIANICDAKAKELRALARVARADTAADGSHEQADIEKLTRSSLPFAKSLRDLLPLPTWTEK